MNDKQVNWAIQPRLSPLGCSIQLELKTESYDTVELAANAAIVGVRDMLESLKGLSS